MRSERRKTLPGHRTIRDGRPEPSGVRYWSRRYAGTTALIGGAHDLQHAIDLLLR